MVGTPTETGIVIPVLELDDLVQRWRPLADAIPPVGVPAHITVLYPWIPPPVPPDDLARLAELARTREPFEFVLTEIRWFGSEVVYVAPEPAGPFAKLAAAVMREWPEYPPYEGEIDDPVPHLTLGHGGPREHMTAAGNAARELLPVACRAEELWLMVGGWDPPVWSIEQRFRIGR